MTESQKNDDNVGTWTVGVANYEPVLALELERKNQRYIVFSRQYMLWALLDILHRFPGFYPAI